MEEKKQKTEKLVRLYFKYIKDLRNKQEKAVENLVDMWDEDGIFEFVGSPPVTGTFKGLNAITTLYKNRLQSNNMKVKLEGVNATSKKTQIHETELGLVDTTIDKIRIMDDDTAVATWISVISTTDKQGFQVSGSHHFSFKDEKITNLKIVVSPKPEQADALNINELSIQDVGQLSLAAWAVV